MKTTILAAAILLAGCATVEPMGGPATQATQQAYSDYANCMLVGATMYKSMPSSDAALVADAAHSVCYPEFMAYHASVERYFYATVSRVTPQEARREADESARNASSRWRGEVIGVVLKAARESTSTQQTARQ